MIRSSLIKNILLSVVFTTSLTCGSNKTEVFVPISSKVQNYLKKQNPIDKYAVVVVGSSRGEKGKDLIDPLDKNNFFLRSTFVYKHLEELGFKHENIYYLYADGTPDFSEQRNGEVIQRIRKNEFNEPVQRKRATIKNLEGILNQLSKKVDGNDVFVVSIATHGNPYVLEMYNSQFGDSLTPNKLSSMLKKIKPGKALLYVDACHSGAYIKKLHLDDYVVISGTQEHTLGWSDRDFSGASYFFENLTDPMSDTNVDGKITIDEAFRRSKIEAKDHLQRIMPYLLKRYNWEGANPYEAIKSMSLQPMIIVGKNASAMCVMYDLGHFKKR
jgi:hypothetical protein